MPTTPCEADITPFGTELGSPAFDKSVGKSASSHLQAKNELPNMQGALERSHDNQYHLYNVDGFANHITEGAKVVSPLRSHFQQHVCIGRLLLRAPLPTWLLRRGAAQSTRLDGRGNAAHQL